MTVNLSENSTGEYGKEADVKKAQASLRKIAAWLLNFYPIPLSEKLFFVQHLGIMLKAGISLSVSLATLAKETTNFRFKAILGDLAANVEKGVSFTESLKPHEKVFGQLFINMIDSGEITGKLEDVLKQLYIQLKKHHELISKVKGALTYPIVITTAMFGIGIFMMTTVVPRMTDMFKTFKAELPLPTKILIAVSDNLVAHGVLFLIGFILAVLIFIQILRTRQGRYIFQSITLKIPIFSSIIKKINLARFARTISSLLKTDIMIIKCFQISANVIGNLHYRQALMEMSEKIKKGGNIHDVVASYPALFPPVVTQMILVGEETGELDFILEELAEFYEGEVDQVMNNLPSIIEPLLILVLGVVIGGMAVSIVLPMYSITTSI